MHQELSKFKDTIPLMEETTVQFGSISQQTLASAEEMMDASNEQMKFVCSRLLIIVEQINTIAQSLTTLQINSL